MSTVVKPIQIPEMNPVRFVKIDHEFEGFQTLISDWWVRQLASWDIKADFYQPWNIWDYIGVQIFLGGLYQQNQSNTKLQIVDCSGIVKAEIDPSYFGTLPGNRIKYAGIDFSMSTVNWQTSFGSYITKEGVYYLRLKLAYEYNNALQFDYYISEPLSVKNDHRDTRILEYISYSNKLGVDYTSMFFHLRVKGNIAYRQPKMQSVTYDDQEMNPRIQSATPYREIWLEMGYPGGMPMYMYDKVNRAFANDYVLCDKVRYSAKGNEIEIGNKVARYERFAAKLKLREYDADAQSLNVSTIPLQLFPAWSSGNPYYMYRGAMKNNTASYTVNFYNAYEINSVAEEDTFIASVLNVQAKSLANLQGYFKRDAGYIVYVNGAGEAYDTSDCVVFTKSFTLHYAKSPFGTINPQLVFDSDRAAIVFKYNYEGFNIGSGTIGTYQTDIRTYNFDSSDSQVNIRIWHNEGIKRVQCSAANANEGPLAHIYAGFIPSQLEYLVIFYPLFPNGLDFTAFPATMKGIDIRYGAIFFGGSSPITGFNKNWTQLTYINLSSNWFDNAGIDSVFNQHYNANGYTPPSSGIFIINNQLPGGATATAASLTARNKLTGLGWTVIF